ncbi:MAG: polymorphic toxin type 17 domain-containing protein, partial [Pseudonocardiales bacterium]
GLLVVDDKTFFKAPQAYWMAQDTEAKGAARYPTQWVRVSPQDLGIDPRTLLAPDVLAAKFPTSVGNSSATPLSTINGSQTRQVSDGDETVYLTTAEPYRIVRVTSRSDKFDLDTAFLADAAVPALFQRIDTEVQHLDLAIDSQVVHSVDGKVLLSPCGQTSCTAKATINTLTTPYANSTQPTAADVQINFTLDRRPIGTCTKVLTLPPGGKAPAACVVNYRLPADGHTHSIEAVVLATARAVLAPDLARIRQNLADESVGWRLRQAGESGLPGSSDQDGPYRFVVPTGFDPNAGPLPQSDGGYPDADGNLWTEVPAKGDAAKRKFTREWKVKLGPGGLAKWQDKAKQSKGDYFLSVTPDGRLSD